MNFDGYEEPVSRAFWGSDDFEEDSTTVTPTFTLEWLHEPCIAIKTLVVVAGNVVTGAVNKCISHDVEKVCMVNSSAEFNVAALYKLSDDLCILGVSASVDLAASGTFVEAISEIISKSEKIIALTNEKMSRLNGTEHDNASGSTLWRSLSNVKGISERLSWVPALKSPNFIVGVAAGVVGYAQFLNIPATVYILYVAEDAYDTETLEATVNLFAKLTNSPPPKLDRIAKTFNNNKLKLYI